MLDMLLSYRILIIIDQHLSAPVFFYFFISQLNVFLKGRSKLCGEDFDFNSREK